MPCPSVKGNDNGNNFGNSCVGYELYRGVEVGDDLYRGVEETWVSPPSRGALDVAQVSSRCITSREMQ